MEERLFPDLSHSVRNPGAPITLNQPLPRKRRKPKLDSKRRTPPDQVLLEEGRLLAPCQEETEAPELKKEQLEWLSLSNDSLPSFLLKPPVVYNPVEEDATGETKGFVPVRQEEEVEIEPEEISDAMHIAEKYDFLTYKFVLFPRFLFQKRFILI